MSRKPNILLIHSDQHRYDCIAAHGLRKGLQTPNLDALAASGTVFTQAFATIPICTPARASLITGAWPTTHGSFCIPSAELNRAARRELPILTELLAEAGYRNCWTGKYHEELERNPSQQASVHDYVPVWNYRQWREAQGIPALERPHGLFGDVDEVCPHDKGCLAWQASHVIRQLEACKDGPFFIRWDPPEPHLPCNPEPIFAEKFNTASLEPWSSFPETFANKPVTQKRQARIWGTAEWTWEDWLPVVRLYHAIIAEMDHHIGRVLQRLEDLGLAENTLVIYSTDHGDFCGGHRLMDKHFNMYDDVTRVPLIVRWPKTVPQGKHCDAFASNSIDIARTILEAAGIVAPPSFVGQNLLAMAAGTAPLSRRYAYSQYFGTESGAASIRMLRDHRYKFVYHPTGDMHEFYDLETDPGELFNRIQDPTLSQTIARFKHDLWNEMKAIGDRLACGWTRIELQGEPPLAQKLGLPHLKSYPGEA